MVRIVGKPGPQKIKTTAERKAEQRAPTKKEAPAKKKPTIRQVSEAERREKTKILTTEERKKLPTREEREKKAAEAKKAIEEREFAKALEEQAKRAKKIDVVLGRSKPAEIPSVTPIIPTVRRGPAITQAIQAPPEVGIPTKTITESREAFAAREAAISAKIPTLEDIQAAGREFARERPRIARGLFESLEFGAGVARKVIPEEVGVPIGEFAIGAFKGVQEKPLKTAAFFGATLATGPALKAVGTVGRVAGIPKVIAPVTERIARVPGITRLPGLTMGGIFAKQIEEEITAPTAAGFAPTSAEMARRAGMIFTTEIAPIAAGIGTIQAVGPIAQRIRMERAFKQLETPIAAEMRVGQAGGVGVTRPTGKIQFVGRRALPSEIQPFETQRILRFDPKTGMPRIKTITRKPPKLVEPRARIEEIPFEPIPKLPPTTGKIKITEEIAGIKVTRPVEITAVPIRRVPTIAARRRVLPKVTEPRKISLLEAEEAKVSLVGPIETQVVRPTFGEAAFRREVIPTQPFLPTLKRIAPPATVSFVSPISATAIAMRELLTMQKITPLEVQIPMQRIMPLEIQIPTVGQVQEQLKIPEKIQRQQLITVPTKIVTPISAVKPIPKVRTAIATPSLPFLPLPTIPTIPKKAKKVDRIETPKFKARKFEKMFENPIASPFGNPVGKIKK